MTESAAAQPLTVLQRLKLDAELTGLARQRTTLTEGVPMFAFKVAQIAARIVTLLRLRGADLDAPKREREAFAAEEPDLPEQPRKPTGHLYEFDPNRTHGERKKDNAAAMALLREIDAGTVDASTLTDEQKQTLAKYSGTGGNLVGADGLKGSAYEYYTPKPIAEGMWALLGELGFNGGKVLDPCSGVGIFGATAPANVAMESVELNETSGRINQLVNGGPGYNAVVSPFEAVASRTADGLYDAVITNVPFGGVHDRGANRKIDSRYQDQPLETYFILRTLEKLKPGGLAAFIVPPRVVSAKGGGREEQLRLQASYMAEFMGAYRLPNSVFGTADADTITDVIVLRKFGRDAAAKIEELREQNPEALVQANVLWQEFIGGRYFEGEGRRYVLGEFKAKDPSKFRDVDRVVSDQSVGNIAKLMRKFPGSRIDWKALEATETEPIEYAEGDCMTLAGQTLQMRDGAWVAIGKDASSDRFDNLGPLLSSPLAAVSAKVNWAQAGEYVEHLRARSLDLEMPQWLRLVNNDLQSAPAGERATLWNALTAGLAATDAMNEHAGEPGFNYLEEYAVLSEALQATSATKAPTSFSRAAKAAFTKARIIYTRKDGFSALWRGEGAAEVEVGQLNEEAQVGALQYKVGAALPVADLQRIYGERFDVMADDDWCLNADGTTAKRADDYYSGNVAEFLRRIDAEIKAAPNEAVRAKLLRQKEMAGQRFDTMDPTQLRFNLFSPFVTIEEKCEFLRRFMHPAFNVGINNLGEPYIVYEGRSGNNATLEENLMSRVASYVSGNAAGKGVRSLALQGKELGISDREALELLRKYSVRLNTQFDGWVKANKVIIDRMQATANDPERLYFNEVDDTAPIEIPGMNPELALHGYQNAYVRKQARSFGGINGFDVGLGKAQPLDAKIMTPSGWKRMGDVKVGDLVIAVDGTAVPVTGVFPQGEKEIFEVEFSDGAKTRCCDEHLWETNTESDRKKERYHRRLGRSMPRLGSVKSLSEIRQSLVYQTQKNHQIPMVAPIQFPEQALSVRPYIMGVLLGDGGMTHMQTTFTTVDAEIASRVSHLLREGFGDAVSVVPRVCTDRAQSYGITRARADARNPVRSELDRFGLAGKGSPAKFIPDAYLLGSVEQRIELLRGLMDTDGFVSKDGVTVQFTSTSRMLAQGVQQLVQSLGGIAWIRTKTTTHRDAHTVALRMPAAINPFHLARKAERVKPKSKYLPVRYFTAVRPVGRALAQCISIDHPTHLYVTDDYIVTHNTFTALACAQYVQSIGVKKKTVFVVPNAVLSNWRREAARAYVSTDDCLFVGLEVNEKTGKATVQPSNYARDFTRVLENKHRKIFCTLEAFSMLPMKEESIERYEAYMASVDPSFSGGERKADAERAASKLSDVTEATGTKSSALPFFEDLGIDSIVADEGHMFKNSKDTLDFSGAKFLSVAEASQRGRDMQMKAWYVRGLTASGDGVLPLTATPITNSPLEIYSMLTLAVGEKKVHDLFMGVAGADAFMNAMCIIEDDEDEGIDGTVKSYRVFRGLQNVNLLRSAIGAIATIKTAKDVAAGGDDLKLPESPEKQTRVDLPRDTVTRLEEYKNAYRAARELMKGENGNPDEADVEALERVQARLGESLELVGHPFNLIQKMTALIADPELDERATFYTVLSAQQDVAAKVVAAFNKLGKVEQRARTGPWTEDDAVVGKVTVKDGDNEATLLKIKVRAGFAPDGRIYVDTLDFKLQQEFEKLADKSGLDLDCSISPKLAALLENVKSEEGTPRSVSGRVKQLVFCDVLPLHNKIKRVLSKHAGIPRAAIEVVSGQSIKNPEQMQDIQDGFNAEGDENRFRAIIANEKAEVGINLQKGTQAIHHLTIGWTPDSQHQRNGRGVRQGNTTGRVNIYHYDADGTFDEYKRNLTSRKADWIGAVMDAQGGNEVHVSGGLTSDQYDELIESMGDTAKIQAIQDRAAARETLQRADNARQRQLVNLQTAQSQAKFLKEHNTIKEWLAAQAMAAFDLNVTLADMAKRSSGKMKPETLVRFETRKAELRAKLDGMLRELDEAAVYKKWGRDSVSMTTAVTDPTFSYAKTNAKRREEVERLALYSSEPNEQSSLYADWQANVTQARAMIDEAFKDFERIAKGEGGAHSARMAEAFRDGKGLILDGKPYVGGMFVRLSDGKLTILNADVNALRYPDVRMRLTDALRGATVIGFESPDYDAAVAEAAAWDDAQADVPEHRVDLLFSSISADVAARRKTVTLVRHSGSSLVLPSPYFRYAINPADADTLSAPVRELVNAQAGYITRWDGAAALIPSSTEVQTSSDAYSSSKRIAALASWAKGLGIKVTVDDLSVVANGAAGQPDRVLPLAALELVAPSDAKARLSQAETQQQLDEVAVQILAEATTWIEAPAAWSLSNINDYTLRSMYNTKAAQFKAVERHAAEQAEKAAAEAQAKEEAEALEASRSEAFKAYRSQIEQVQGEIDDVLREQIGADDALKDGEREQLMAMVIEPQKTSVAGVAISATGMIGLTGQTLTRVQIQGVSKQVKDFIKMAAEEAGGRARWRGDQAQWDVRTEAWELLCNKYPDAAKLVNVCPAVA